MNFDEFRILISPDVQDAGKWAIQVANTPDQDLNAAHGTLDPKVSVDEIRRLRNPSAVPDSVKLRALGQNVLHSIMSATALLGFRLCLREARKNNRGLRLVVQAVGDMRDVDGISLLDIPLEAVFSDEFDFIATNTQTPVSRGVATLPDRGPVQVTLPLRILLVASEPTDMPPVEAADERRAVLQALDSLIRSRAVVVDECSPPTVSQFNSKLQEGYHIVHFIGHGDYEVVGLDPNPQPHLYFEDGTAARRRKPVDATQLFTMLRNGNVPLVVLTACSTAAASPNGASYPVVAFESLAQNLIERQSGPLAAVAMQFDLETAAAEVFSRAFYSKLLTPEWTLDSAISHARTELLAVFGTGHRCWVNPTLYWRCKDGRAFDIRAADDTSLTPEQLAEIREIESQIEVYVKALENLSNQPPEVRAATAPLQMDWQAEIDKQNARRSVILGDSVRLLGGKPDANGEIDVPLMVRLRLAGTLGDITVDVKFDPATITLLNSGPGSSVSGSAVFVQNVNPGETRILVREAGNGVSWEPGEYELAKLRFRLIDPRAKVIFHIEVASVSAVKNGGKASFRPQNAVIFGSLVDP